MDGASPIQCSKKPLPNIPRSSKSETTSHTESHGYSPSVHTYNCRYDDNSRVSYMTDGQDSISSDDYHQLSPGRDITGATAGGGYESFWKTEKCRVGVHPVHLNEVELSHRQQSSHQKANNIVTQFWLYEAGACIFSLLALASIAGVLIYEDGKQLDQWAWSIPPTAVVSFIGTLAKASLVMVLAQVLSQLKWLHFQRTKSLHHMRVFDWSSRGPLGSLIVIWSSKEILTSIAAILMILSLLVDPFIQLVFSFPAGSVQDDTQQSSFLRMNNWEGEVGPKSFLPSERVWRGINQGLTATTINTTLICPSGNCTWTEPIRTLGVCSSCVDVTASVKKQCRVIEANNKNRFGLVSTCNYTWPGDGNNASPVELDAGLWFGSGEDNGNYPSRTKFNSSAQALFSSISNYTANYTHDKTIIQFDGKPVNISDVNAWDGNMGIRNGQILQLKAIELPSVENNSYTTDIPLAKCTECEMHWCERSYENLTVINGGPAEFSLSERPLWFLFPLQGMMTPNSAAVAKFHLSFGAHPNEFDQLRGNVWNFDYRVSDDLSVLLLPFLNSFYVDRSESPQAIPVTISSVNQQTDLSSNQGAVLGLAFSGGLNFTMDKLAHSLTETIRTSANATAVQGKTYVLKTFIHVRWAWLALPLALMIITSVLLMIVAIQSHRKNIAVWKDDPLALLFHRIDGVQAFPGSNSETGPADLDNLADELYVRLDGNVPFTFVRDVDGRQNKQPRKQASIIR